MKIIETIRKWVNRMLPAQSIEQVYHTDLAMSDEMLSRITLWEQMYAGTAPWTNEEIASLRLEQGVVREFANIVLNEMTVKISHEPLEKLYKKAVRDLNKHLQAGLASGAMIIKPLNTDNVQYLTQSGFRVLSYDAEGAPMDVVFPDVKKIGDSDYRIRLERHTLDPSGRGLTITNRAFCSSTPDTLGREISLTAVEEWASFPALRQYPSMQRHAFGYYVNPIDNTVDFGHGGVSVFDAARYVIRKADTQLGRLDWEFESAERRIDADQQAIKLDADGNPTIPSKIYRSVDVQDLFKEFSPALRHEGFIKGLDEYKRCIEFIVGLSYGDLSNPQSVEKTAAEILAAKQRKYNAVTAIQEKLKICLEDLTYAIAFYNSMANSGYTFTCTVQDSILTDSAEERKQDMQDVSMGAMQLWEYRMKHYGEDEKTAKRMVAGAEPDFLDDEVSVSADKASVQSGAEVQGKSLNGAQTQSLIAIMAQYSSGALTEGQAVNLIATAIGITKDEARKLLNGDVS